VAFLQTNQPFRQQERTVAEKPDGGSWAVVRYVPSLPTDKVEGEFPAFVDGWFAQEDEALGVAQNWVSQHPEHAVVVIRANRFLGKGSVKNAVSG
jgi:hypothetical protein